MLDWDEIKTELERLYDEVQRKIKETEGTDEERFGQSVAHYIWRGIDAIDTHLHFLRRRTP